MTRLGARPRPPIVHIGSYTSRTSRPPRKFRRCEGSARRRAARPAAPRVAPLAGPERRRCLLRARSRRGVVVALSRSRRGAAPEWNRGAGRVVRLKRGRGDSRTARDRNRSSKPKEGRSHAGTCRGTALAAADHLPPLRRQESSHGNRVHGMRKGLGPPRPRNRGQGLMPSAPRPATRREPSRLRGLGVDGLRPAGENGRRVSGPALAISWRRTRRALDQSLDPTLERLPDERRARR